MPAVARRTIAVAALLAGALLVGCSEEEGDEDAVDFVQREDSRLVKVQTVGVAAFGPVNPHTAIPTHAAAAFGQPSSVDRRGELCRHRWPSLALTIDFAAPGGADPCGTGASIEGIRVAGRAAAEAGWRTAEGIRPGMSVAAARRIYPEARRAGQRLILVEGPARGGAGAIVTVLAVRTSAGQVTGMTFPIE